MGGAKHRRKGDNVERQIVALHRDMGVHAERVPLSGASRYRGNGPMSIFMPTARMRVRWGVMQGKARSMPPAIKPRVHDVGFRY